MLTIKCEVPGLTDNNCLLLSIADSLLTSTYCAVSCDMEKRV